MAVLGQPLVTPESGWQRIETSDSKFNFSSGWATLSSSDYSGGSTYYTRSPDISVEFKFYGTDFRIIESIAHNRTKRVDVYIDGVFIESFSQYITGTQNNTLIYEKTLPEGEHVIKLINKGASLDYCTFDAIDIKGTSYMMDYPIGKSFTSPEAGWKRYDNLDPQFIINGNWTTFSNASLWKGSSIYFNSTLTDGEIRFRFFGSKLRFIGYGDPNYNKSIRITINGQSETFSSASSANVSQMLCYEKTNLIEGYHDVVIDCNGSSSYWHFDAVDIDDTGYMVAQVGQRLSAPEPDWKRYDNNIPTIKYEGSGWISATGDPNTYAGTAHYIPLNGTSSNSIKFNFYGTKLRIIDLYWTNRVDNVTIEIDGKVSTWNPNNPANKYQILVFEVSGLEKGLHEVKLSTTSLSGTFSLDAVDIDLDGRMFHPDEVTNITELEIGKRIRCNYVVTASGVAGEFKNIGKETSDFIPSISATPNGDFYFIVADEYNGKKILIADRNIQSISWDTLNSNGLVFGVQKDLGEKNYTFAYRLLTGGINATDKDNEWDKYIVNSTLNGTIIAGSNGVWNWSGTTRSWTSTTYPSYADRRVQRGGTSADAFIANNNGSIATNIGSTVTGYRPLVELKALPIFKSFVKHDGAYKKYAPKVFIESNDNVIPVMTSNTSPSGVASASSINSASFDAYQAFNGIQDERYGWASLTPVSWLQYQFPTKKIIYKYSLSMRTNVTYYATGEPPKSWTFEGSNDGVNWVILDTQTNNTTLARGSIEEYRINNSDAYTYYRVNVSANQGNATITVIAELKMFEKTPKGETVGWNTISATLPLEDTFINEGIGDLSVLDRKNEVFVQTMTANGSLGSGKIFKGSIDLKKYFEITSVSVK